MAAKKRRQIRVTQRTRENKAYGAQPATYMAEDQYQYQSINMVNLLF